MLSLRFRVPELPGSLPGDMSISVTPVNVIPFYHTSYKPTAAQNEVTLSYDRVRGLYLVAVVFEANIDLIKPLKLN